MTDIGNAIRFYRTQRGLSQQTLSSEVGISISYLSLLERGQRDPRFTTLVKIASAMGVPVFLLVYIAEKPDQLGAELNEKISYVALQAAMRDGADGNG